jgi:hypothetical protein
MELAPPRGGAGKAPESAGKVNRPKTHTSLLAVRTVDRWGSGGNELWIRKRTPAKMNAARRRRSLATETHDTAAVNTPGEVSVARKRSAKEEKM